MQDERPVDDCLGVAISAVECQGGQGTPSRLTAVPRDALPRSRFIKSRKFTSTRVVMPVTKQLASSTAARYISSL